MKGKQLFGIIFVIFFVGVLVANIIIIAVNKSKGVITLDSSNIVEQLENKRTLGQSFKIEKDSYEIYNQFYIGHSNNGKSGPLTVFYDDYFFTIRIKGQDNTEYYMAVKVKTESNTENSILTSLQRGETVDLTGNISKITATYGTTKVIDEFNSALGYDKENVLEYCMNIN